MRTSAWVTILGLAGLAVACGDQPTEPVPDRPEPSQGQPGGVMRNGGMIALATSSSDDGMSITTDKDDYAPGDTVWFTGGGWPAEDSLDIVLTDSPTGDEHRWTIPTTADGTFRDSTYVVNEGDVAVTFTLTATSRNTGRWLTVTFTDGNPDAPVLGAQTPSPVLAGNTATYSVSVSYAGNADQCTVVLTAAPTATPAWPSPPPGGFFSFSPASVTGQGGDTRTSTLTVTVPAGTAANTYKFRVTADQTADDADCQGNNETSGDINLVVAANAAPNAPTGLGQFRSDATTTIALGAATNETTVVFKGTVSDPNAGNTVRLQVEVQPVGTTFTNTPTATSATAVASGSVASATVTGLADANYHWQARAIDNSNLPGAWVSFGGNGEGATDFQVKTGKPSVTINQASGQADPTNASPINFTVVFSEAVTGFVTGDVTLSGTAGATTGTVTGSGTTYNVAVSGMTSDGTVIATIAADKAQDLAGNGNTASTSSDNTVTYDTTKPTVIINQSGGQSDPTNASPITFTVLFNESVADFATGDVTLSGTAGATTATVSGSGQSYTVQVSGMTGDGTVIASIASDKAHDAAGNGNTASTSTDNTVTYDATRPTVTINQKSGQADPTNASPINFTVVFSESVADFATGDVTLGGTANATTAAVSGGPTTYNVAVSGMAGSGTVIASIGANVAHDAATNGNLASTSTDNTVTYDADPPVVSNVAVGPNPTNGTVNISATATVDDAATGNSDITAAAYSIDGGAPVAMTAVDGAFDEATENVKATIPASVIAALSNGPHTICVRGTEGAGNTSSFAAAGACATLVVDKAPPVVSNVVVTPNPTNGTVNVNATATVDDAASGASDITAAAYSIDGGAAQPMTAVDGAFDETAENVKATIPAAVIAALSNGPHTVCVQGTEAAGNSSSFSAATACATLNVDKVPPVVSSVTATPSPTNGSVAVTVNGTVDDAGTGNSDITAAAYNLDGGPAIAMTASDAAFDEPSENVTATIAAATVGALADGNHTVCVRGTDAAGNTGSFGPATACATFKVDKLPPIVSNVAVTPNPTNGTVNVHATATVDDAATGNSDITAAAYSIDGGAAQPMTAVDGTFDEATEDVKATIPASVIAALSDGAHTICVRGSEGAGNTSSFSAADACATLVVDKQPPVVSNVVITPNPTNGTVNVNATATVDDAATGGSDITAAAYSIDGGSALAMTASDGAFDEPTENVKATIPASVIAALSNGTHTVCVRGTEAATNTSSFSAAGACATLKVDKVPPVVSTVTATPSPTNGTVAVNVTGKVDDATTGNSDITGAAYSLDGGAAHAMVATDGSFDEPAEDVKVSISAATIAALNDGSHTVCVQGTDAAGNTSSFAAANACATFIVDKLPPVVSNVGVTPNPTNGTVNVHATATVDDAATGNSDITAAAYSIDGGAPIAMTASDGAFDEATEDVKAIIPASVIAALTDGPHTVCVIGTEGAGNTSSFAAANACATLTVDKLPPVVSNVVVTPNPTNGTVNVDATAEVDDAATGNSDITAAAYSIDGASAQPMAASDGTFDEPTENVKATIPASVIAALSNGTHTVCVRGTEAATNTSSFSAAGACATLKVDKVPPVVSGVTATPSPTNGSAALNLNAKVDDAAAGNSDITGAAYSLDGGAALPMIASDGSFDEPSEDVKVAISAATIAALTDGSHAVCVRGGDAAGNTSSFGAANACTTFIVDKEPPVVSNVAVTPNPTNGSVNVNATATVDDAATGNSDITAAAYSIDGGSALAMIASDGTFDEPTENVKASIPGSVIAALSNGTHTVCVQGSEGAGNTSSFSAAGACATLKVDKVPPVVSTVTATPSPTNGAVAVNVAGKVDDGSAGSSDITAAAYSLDGGSAVAMTATDGSFDEVAEDVKGSIPAATVAGLTNGTHTVCVQGTDAATNTSSFAAANACATFIVDKEPPVVSNVTASPSPTNGTVVLNALATVDDAASGGSDITAAAYSIDGGAVVAMAAVDGAFDEPTENVKATVPASVIAALGNGSHTVCVQGSEGAGNTSSLSAVTACATFIVDKVAPVVSTVSAAPNPSNGSGTVTLTGNVSDVTTGNSKIVSAAYSLDGGAAVAMTASDAAFNSPSEGVTATLSAALSEGSHQFCVQGKDEAGNTSSFAASGACVTLVVDKTAPVISDLIANPNPVAINANFVISAKFTDALTKVTGAQYSLGGAAGPWVNLNAADGSYNSGIETGTITLNKPNADVLDVCVRSTDQAGNTNQGTGIQCIFLAIYDPSAGFVTGGGWITSPTGAYLPDPSLTGKATFGFVSKYLKGATVPTGNTEFQFHAGGMNFSSTNYEWLVVAGNGARAQYKGTGTINGQGGYGFLLTALTSDQLRIKIWSTATNAIVYDNRMGSPDSGNDATPLGGGNIMIQVPKK
jgi:hypothetical protein